MATATPGTFHARSASCTARSTAAAAARGARGAGRAGVTGGRGDGRTRCSLMREGDAASIEDRTAAGNAVPARNWDFGIEIGRNSLDSPSAKVYKDKLGCKNNCR